MLENSKISKLSMCQMQSINGGTTNQGSPNIQFDWDADPDTYTGEENPVVSNPNSPFNKKDPRNIPL
ncbi:hypothetical protein NBT05_05755 [Aquimarina sp. ERC-38]|uniref:hypothetical protein n=1 Tax=Aquimarina sp. ERC-38 TaxID=2949996 RepID=UPI002245F42E|nr:hypothetical protein [Aquimarina sp. ERC-38]UZO81970.1 hypothetical protein NBT05_05755 [Aquimarina sp. ERC-38]